MTRRALLHLLVFAALRLGRSFQASAGPAVSREAAAASAFRLPPSFFSEGGRRDEESSVRRRRRYYNRALSSAMDDNVDVDFDDVDEEADDDGDTEGMGMSISPMQIKFLRKEAAKRKARRSLPRFALPETESSGTFRDETLASIADLLDDNELVEVRGISRNDKREIFGVSEELAVALTYEMGRDAFVIDRNGMSAVLYCAAADEELRGRIQLRTSVGQKNAWTKRQKAPRDHRGQIIRE